MDSINTTSSSYSVVAESHHKSNDAFHEKREEDQSDFGESSVGSSSFHAKSHTPSPRSRPSSPRGSPRSRDSGFGSGLSRFGNGQRSFYSESVFSRFLGFFGGREKEKEKGQARVKRKGGGKAVWFRRRMKFLLVAIGLVVMLLMNWWMFSRLQYVKIGRNFRVRGLSSKSNSNSNSNSNSSSIKGELKKIVKEKKPPKFLNERMLALAAHALAEGQNKPEPKDLWKEPFAPGPTWKPCADRRNWIPSEGNNGYIMVTANGGMNQQRVAVCNAVIIARLLNATLVVPKFLYSSVWIDVSQFSDIYQEEHFINYLTPDIRIVKELPKELQSLDLEAIGSVVTDADISKESKPSIYIRNILPLLHQNKVVHFIGFGNRVAFDPVEFQMQRLRCRCNFHALKFVPKIQETGALLLQRMRVARHIGQLDRHLVGPFAKSSTKKERGRAVKASRYLSLHLRFEIDMVAHSLCDFGGGEEERRALDAYREIHFPALTLLKNSTKLPSPAALRSEGLCPLTPEEAVLMIAALGFKRKTHIYLAGAHIFGGKSRLAALTSLYPNMATKESLLSPSELEPFRNFSSQLAALDFIGCTAADAFAMTDSGSQLSSLVSGFRIYYGAGKMPTLRPNKRRLAGIFLKNNTIEWKVFEQRVRKAIRQTKHILSRSTGRSVYRNPRCQECMCLSE